MTKPSSRYENRCIHSTYTVITEVYRVFEYLLYNHDKEMFLQNRLVHTQQTIRHLVDRAQVQSEILINLYLGFNGCVSIHQIYPQITDSENNT